MVNGVTKWITCKIAHFVLNCLCIGFCIITQHHSIHSIHFVMINYEYNINHTHTRCTARTAIQQIILISHVHARISYGSYLRENIWNCMRYCQLDFSLRDFKQFGLSILEFFISELCVTIIFKQYTRRISVLLFFDILSLQSTLNLVFDSKT